VIDSGDWAFCKERLVGVSRTFSVPIGMLRERLEVAVTCGYLLCRIVDTVEDDRTLPARERNALFDLWLAVLAGYEPARAFEDRFVAITGLKAGSEEYRLAAQAHRVFDVLETLPHPLPGIVTRWVAEMSRGMAIYANRVPGDDGLWALIDLPDLERYCYFVAGTVGHLLTDLFLAEVRVDEPEVVAALRREAEEFGLGLQLVNILKDVTDDLERDWSFLPRSLFEEQGLALADALQPDHRDRAWHAVLPVFDRAEQALQGAFRYTLALPAEATDVRLFCLLPLWMAARTLAVARGNDRVFKPGAPVRISRDEVAAIVQESARLCHDDDALRRCFARLWDAPPAPRALAR